MRYFFKDWIHHFINLDFIENLMNF